MESSGGGVGRSGCRAVLGAPGAATTDPDSGFHVWVTGPSPPSSSSSSSPSSSPARAVRVDSASAVHRPGGRARIPEKNKIQKWQPFF
ncbi:hypothetical protein EYF80_055197 [Liparis tanakae]|uniref:Uncharacterized protein n=1 Tax=Liparis tanakae TaxID=230148 RepID=A0A4Z2F2C7_9TELE|nr:hypothetical protein EYF80_055197 [Liparis tanakae]